MVLVLGWERGRFALPPFFKRQKMEYLIIISIASLLGLALIVNNKPIKNKNKTK